MADSTYNYVISRARPKNTYISARHLTALRYKDGKMNEILLHITFYKIINSISHHDNCIVTRINLLTYWIEAVVN